MATPAPESRDVAGALERRTFTFSRCELRAADGETRDDALGGHAAVFNSLSEDLGGFREKIEPGAFADTLDADVRALVNHDANLLLGRTTSGTLRIAEDGEGLPFEVDMPDTSYARDVQVLVERGDLTQCSFGFRTLEDDWEVDERGQVIRTLKKVELFDVSVVTFPAYVATSVEARNKAIEVRNAAMAAADEIDETDEIAETAENAELAETPVRAGKVLSKKNREQLEAAKSAIDAVLGAAVDAVDDDDVVEENAAGEHETREVEPWQTLRDLVDELEQRGYDDIDDWAVYCLTTMVSHGSEYVSFADDANKVELMRAVLTQLTALLNAVVTEENRELAAVPDDAPALRSYGDVDSFSIYTLNAMIEFGASFIANTGDEGRVELMRAILIQLNALVGVAIAASDDDERADETDESADVEPAVSNELRRMRLRVRELDA